MRPEDGSDFAKAARAEARPSLMREVWGFLRANKKWWLLPIFLVLLLLGLLILLSGTGLAPLIYTLF